MTEEALAALCLYLRTLALQKYPLDEYEMAVQPDGDYTSDASPAPEIAREWARALLTAADADGLGGCRLCRS
jgi:hypothetical protein